MSENVEDLAVIGVLLVAIGSIILITWVSWWVFTHLGAQFLGAGSLILGVAFVGAAYAVDKSQ